MTTKEKFYFISLQIITFGLIWIYWKKRQQTYQNPDQLSVANKITFAIAPLVVYLGQISNIKAVSATHQRIKINYQNRQLLDLEAIKNLKGVSGVFVNDQAISLIVGNQAQLVANALEQLIN